MGRLGGKAVVCLRAGQKKCLKSKRGERLRRQPNVGCYTVCENLPRAKALRGVMLVVVMLPTGDERRSSGAGETRRLES